MATNKQTQKDTAKAKSKTFGRSKKTSKDTAKAKSRTFGRSKRAKEEEEEELLVQEEILRNNPMMQPTDLMGQQAPQEDVNPLALAGLGGAAFLGRNLPAGGVNPQVTGPVSQGLFQSSNIIGRNLPAGGANPQVTGPVSQGSLRPAPNQPVLMGQPQSYQGVPTGPNTPPQFTGSAPARPIPGTQLAPPNQPPAVQSSGPLSAKTTTAKPGTANYSVNRTAPYTMGPAKQFASGVLKTGLIGALTTPNTVADTTLDGAYDSRVAAGEDPDQVRQSLGLASDYGNALQELSGSELEEANAYAAYNAAEQAGQLDIFNSRVAAGEDANQVRIDLGVDANFGRKPFVPETSVADVIIGKQARGEDATFKPEELGQISSIQGTDQDNSAQFVQDYQAGQMGIAKSLQDLGNVDDLRAVEAQLAEKGIVRDLATPFLQAAESLAPVNAMSSFTPRSTFTQADGRIMQEDEFGQQREITPSQLNQFQADMTQLGQPTQTAAPMGVDATRARLGGMTLNQYLNAPGGTEGVSGLRTDPQGRMIPGGFDTRADAYGQYEDEVSQAYQRQSERMQQRADQRGGTAGPRTYGGYTTAQLRGMVGGGDDLRAAQMRAEAGLNPITGNREKTEAERAQSSEQGQLQNQALQARIDVLKQGNPDKVKEAEDAAARMGLEGRAATIFTLGKMGINTETIFEILEASKPGGGGGQSHAALNAAAKNSGQSTYVGPDGQTYDVQ